ncbi:ABC transporter permease [Bryobacter aggregatus]|uniref:ABC transporter permease n=1 Tax=Bryobacter aggregatus TaxID=360054 RepID=UPI001EE34E5A
MFWKSKGFTFAAVAALALGIGSNTAIFSVVNAVLLKPPPFPDSDRIILLGVSSQEGKNTAGSPAKFLHWREQKDVLESAAAFRTGVVNLTSGEVPEQLRSAQVSGDYFKLFGAQLVAGRSFSKEEDLPKGGNVVLITEGLWARRFGSDPQLVGKTIQLGGEAQTVIGIVSKNFNFSDLSSRVPEVFSPFQFDPNSVDQGHYFSVGARLLPGVSLAQANARLEASTAVFRQKFPMALRNEKFYADSLREALTANVRSSLLVLVCAVGMVLLIACANIANLMLARAIGRKREIAIRAAIGAGRGRLIRQLLTESVLLAAVGAIFGSVLGLIGIRMLLSVNTANLPRIGVDGALVGADWRVLTFTIGITLLTGVLFGLIPALQSSRADLSTTLKEGGGRSGSSFRQNKARTFLVVTEVALAVVLLVGSALLIRTSLALGDVKPGYDATNVLTMRMSLSGQRFVKTQAVEQLVRDGLDRLRAVPGVTLASATCCVPLEGGYGLPFLIVGRPLDKGPFHGGGSWKTISPGYFDVFKIPVVRGRSFDERDTAAALPVVVINQAMARQFWPKGDPLGETIWIGKGIMSELATEQPRQIVGIIGDVRDGALNQKPEPAMYVPNAQVPDALNALNVRLTPLAWVMRTTGDPIRVSQAVQEQLRQASGLPISDVRTMDEVVSRSTSRQRFNMLLMTIFGCAALLLAAIGVYGLMAYSVQQRTQEIGIRMALGADTGSVRKMVVLQGMRFVGIGVILGTGIALSLAKLIANFLYGVEPYDVMVFSVVPTLLALTAFIAVLIPAMRATRIDPLQALRNE